MTQPNHTQQSGTIGWQSPSNIAIVKYWGKKDIQIPLNPSVSMTLSESCSKTVVDYRPRQSGENQFTFYFNHLPNPSFEPKLNTFFQYVTQQYPYLSDYHFTISSSNTFPHSTGIASSASSMSALALCITQIHHIISQHNTNFTPTDAGSLARLGSGSACRSIFGGWSLWGKYEPITESSDYQATSINDSTHPIFHHFCDSILVIDDKKKSVSSTAGHHLMNQHPFAQGRLNQAFANTKRLLSSLQNGDIEQFISVCEEEALSLHALMMSSNPGFILLKPNTLVAIEKIRHFRSEQHIPICFTLDAGPNLHLLYPAEYQTIIKNWIDSELKPFCSNQLVIHDKSGNGPQPL